MKATRSAPCALCHKNSGDRVKRVCSDCRKGEGELEKRDFKGDLLESMARLFAEVNQQDDFLETGSAARESEHEMENKRNGQKET